MTSSNPPLFLVWLSPKSRAKIAAERRQKEHHRDDHLNSTTLHDNTINETVNRIEPAHDLDIFSRWLTHNHQWVMRTPSIRKIPTTMMARRNRRAEDQQVRNTLDGLRMKRK
jgi:hypothetical protein